MAKRKNFKISYEGNEVIKHAYNSSILEIEKIVWEIARKERQSYYLTESTREENEFKRGVKATRKWTAEDGKTIVFVIEQIEN